MRRKPGTLLPIEIAILYAGIDLRRRGQEQFHGYAIAREIRDLEAAKRLTGHGTLYRALDRLETAGMLESEMEDPALAAGETRPRRRLYTVTALGERALADVPLPVPGANPRPLQSEGLPS